jgi:hypothetical protein
MKAPCSTAAPAESHLKPFNPPRNTPTQKDVKNEDCASLVVENKGQEKVLVISL